MTSGPLWQVLQGLGAWQVTRIPRRPQRLDAPAGDEGDLLAAQRLAALTSAFHAGGPVAFGWVRESAGGPVRVLAAGQALAAGMHDGQVMLTLPAGGTGTAVGGQDVAAALARLDCWVPVTGTVDGLLDEGAQAGRLRPDRPVVIRPNLEDGLLAAWPGPFGWLVLAIPITSTQLAELAQAVSFALGLAQKRDDPKSVLAAHRLQGRYTELKEAAATGLWRVHLLAGSTTPQAAAQVAGLVCASADLTGLPYALAPQPGCAALPDVLGRTADADVALTAADDPADPMPRAPFHASTAVLAVLARPPAREVPGVRFTLRPDFDVTPEHTTAAGSGLPLGTVLDSNRMPAGSLDLPLESVNRHVFVCGATGAGKSQTVRALLEAATGAGIPWLVAEPAKAEYKLMAARLAGVPVIRIAPGEADEVPAGLNPLEPPAGPGGTRFPLQAHADLVRDLFLAAFDAEEPFPQVLAAALTRCYEQAGWDLALGEPAVPGAAPAYPALGDLQAAAEQVVTEIGYGREITDNVRGFIKVRLASLRLGTTGRFFEGGHPLNMAQLLGRNVVLEIQDAGDDAGKAFLMGTVLIHLAGHLRMRAREQGPVLPGLAHLTVIEEAHRLLRNPQGRTGAAAHAVEMFAALLAEVRAYGEGLIIAEQIPAKLIGDVIKNTAVKITHRLPAADDRATVGATMNITGAQSQYLVTLTPGEAAVHTDGMDYPILVRMPDGTIRETSHPAPTVSAAGIVGRRSPGCGPACQAAPCTLRQIRAAQRAAGTEPLIVLWAELAVLAHLTGWLMPMPGPEFTAVLRGMDVRLRGCALSQAVDAAVAARAPAITSRVSAPALAVHVTTALCAALSGSRCPCAASEPEFLAPCYQWALILDELKTAGRRGTATGRHPDAARWESAYGRVIPGDTRARQLGAVQRWYDDDQRDRVAVHTVAYGTRTPSAIEHSIGARLADDDWEQRLDSALATFHDCRWPANYLHPATPPSGTGHE